MRPAIVVGSAPCAQDDYERALALYPDAFVIAINGAASIIEKIDAMVAGHTTQAPQFVKARNCAFPNAPTVAVWANWALPVKRHPARKYPSVEYPQVTDWFPSSFSTGATTAGKAIRMALNRGYEPIILCGCPLDGSGYHANTAVFKFEAACKRVGDPTQQMHKSIVRYRDTFKLLAAIEFSGRVFSMSGYTQQLLGAPPGNS